MKMRVRSAIAVLFCVCFFSSTGFASVKYYVSETGNDSDDGLSHATAWRTLNQVNGADIEDGAKVYLNSGDTFSAQSISVHWGGSADEYAELGCYKYTASSGEQECSPDDPKPTIQGTFVESCRKSRTCLLDDSSAVPSQYWWGLVTIKRNYVKVSNLRLIDSAGKGVNTSRNLRHLAIENLDIENTAHNPIQINRGSQYLVIRNNVARLYNLCEELNYERCQKSGWPGGIALSDSRPAHALIENNTITEGAGEGFNCLRASHVIYRGNKAGKLRSAAIYLDNCSDSVVENNLIWGDPNNEWGTRAISAFVIALEDYGNWREDNQVGDSSRNIIRNNIASGLERCFSAGMEPGSADAGRKLGFEAYGNTCVGSKRRSFNLASTSFPESGVDEVKVYNNIFFGPNASGDNKGDSRCVTHISPKISFDHNFWDTIPSLDHCVGSNDLVGNPKFVNSISSFEQAGAQSHPNPEDFSLQVSSPAKGMGMQLNSEMIDTQKYEVVPAGSESCGPLDQRALGKDHLCRERPTNPTMGALELGSAVKRPLPPTIIFSGLAGG